MPDTAFPVWWGPLEQIRKEQSDQHQRVRSDMTALINQYRHELREDAREADKKLDRIEEMVNRIVAKMESDEKVQAKRTTQVAMVVSVVVAIGMKVLDFLFRK